MKNNKTFNIYCDESTHLPNDGHPYMLMGYTSIAYNQIKLANNQIQDIKSRHNYLGELKWINVHEATLPLYQDIVDYFFMTDMQFRAVVVDKDQIDENREDYTFNDFYYRMYYQLLHHKTNLENNYNVFLDIKDTCGNEKLKELKRLLRFNTAIRNLQFIRSQESHYVQIADVLMGAINYNLRMKRGELEGRSLAKKKIIQRIMSHCPDINLDRTTPMYSRKFNLFFITLK